MPMYEFKCLECGKEYEELMRNAAENPPPCPACQSLLAVKKISLFSGSATNSGSCAKSGFS